MSTPVQIRYNHGGNETVCLEAELREDGLYDHEDGLGYEPPIGGIAMGVRYVWDENASLMPWSEEDGYWLEVAPL